MINNKILLLKVENDSDIIPFEFHGDTVPIRKGDMIIWETHFASNDRTYRTKGVVTSACVVEPITGDWKNLYGHEGKTVTLKRAYRPIFNIDDQIDEDDF